MDFCLSDELQSLAADAAALGDEWAARRQFPEDGWLVGHDVEFAKVLADRRWIGMTWPTEHGGGGRSRLERFVVYEQLISRGAPIAAMWVADRQMGPSLMKFGTDAQCQRWLPGILAGESMWCIGMSEPDNGSDLANLRTRAVPAGENWVINGQKIWTSGAAVADWMYLVARTDLDAPAHAGLSDLVVDMRSPGIDVRPIVDMTGNQHFCEVHFSDVIVPRENLVGERNGSFRQVMRQLEDERGGIDRLVSNRRLLTDLSDDGCFDLRPPLRQELAALEIDYRIGRMLVLRETLGQGPRFFSAATKIFCTDFEQRLSQFAVRVLGPEALVIDADYGIASRAGRSVCYSPAYTIMGGTSNILRNIVGERILGLPR